MVDVKAVRNVPNSVAIASGPFKFADLVVQEEPWMQTVCAVVKDLHCYCCLKPLWQWGPVFFDRTQTPKLKNNRCSGCHFAKYCSSECQKSDWIQRHKFECAALRRIAQRKRKEGEEKCPEYSDSLFQLMFKIIAKLTHHGTEKRQFLGPKEGERTFWDLHGAVDDIKTDPPLMQRLAKMRKIIANDLQLSEEKMDQVVPFDEFVEIFARVKCNAYYIMGNDNRYIGAGIYIVSSSIQHSCKPNAVRFYDGKRLSIRATSQVESVSQLRISLVDELEPLRYRRKNLKDLYRIDCQCGACSDPKKDAEKFALNCINPNCDAKIPSDERADQPCRKCGQTGFDRQKEFYEIHDAYLNSVDKSIDNPYPCKNHDEMQVLGHLKMKQLYHPTNPMWVDINLRSVWIRENIAAEGFVKYYRTAEQIIRPWVSPIDPRLGWIAYRSTTQQVPGALDLAFSLKYLSEAKRILCDVWGVDEEICERARKDLQSLCGDQLGEQFWPTWQRALDGAFGDVDKILKETYMNCFPPDIVRSIFL